MRRKSPNTRRYYSHWVAVRRWDIPFISAHFDLDALTGGKTHTTVFSYRARYQKKGHQVHYCTLNVPAKYLLCDERTGEGIVAPPLAYLQVVGDLDDLEAVLLAILFCAFPRGVHSRPLTTVAELRRCAEEMRWHRGREKALRALRYAKDGCNSPREAVIFMLLSLPHKLGGMNVRDLKFNQKVVVNTSGFAINSRGLAVDSYALTPGKSGVYFGDFVLPAERKIIEFNSKTHHSSERAQLADTRRAQELASAGYEVIGLTTQHVEDPTDFERFALNLLRVKLRRRIRIRARRFWKMRICLQDMLMDCPVPDEIQGDIDRLMAHRERRDARRERERRSIMRMFAGPIRWGLEKWRWNRDMLRRLADEERARQITGRPLGTPIYNRTYAVRPRQARAPA